MGRPLLVLLALVLILGLGPGADPAISGGPVGGTCDLYPDSRFVIEDGGTDAGGHPIRFCSEYLRHGAEEELGLPISRPFRVGDQLLQAFEYGVLAWNADTGAAAILDSLDVLHAAGRDPELQRLGVPPAQPPGTPWLTDPSLRAAYVSAAPDLFGLPTSAPTPMGPFVIQRFQKSLIRRWVASVPYDLSGSLSRSPDDGSWVERLMVGDLLRSTGLIPAAALVTDPGRDPRRYNSEAAPSAPATLWSSGPVAIGGWDSLYHKAGAFDVGTAGHDVDALQLEVDQAAKLGFTLAINGYIGRDSEAVHSSVDRDVSIIDTYPWGRIEAACGASVQLKNCELGPDQLAAIAQDIQHHLRITREDDSVVGYWVLDDYPGQIRPAIELIHELVTQENLMAREIRPTICGFGGDLDSSSASSDTRVAFDEAVANFTPTGCDAVALYPYARGGTGQTDTADWSMAALLPHMLAELQRAGWDPTNQPLIGIPQTFRFDDAAFPTAADVAAQTSAYCAAGASSVVFYAFDDSHAPPKDELFDATDLQDGARQGLATCQSIWAAGS
ncbi:MAG: hypothetical protein JOY61_13540 [Chloroflexi bacterium]|nr:hypothetical protein [Chloroflexota bacterium]